MELPTLRELLLALPRPVRLRNFSLCEDLISSPFLQHPAPPPVPPPVATKPVLVEGARRKPYNIWAAPQAVERGQGVGHPLWLPSLNREEPLDRPKEALGLALRLLQDDEWERKTEGLRLVRALAEHHCSVVQSKLHIICKAVNEEVKNLRTAVSRDAIKTMAHLFTYLQQEMDSEVAGAARTLLNKAGESSLSVREGVELALSTMVFFCSPDRVLCELLAGGLSHINLDVRATTAFILVRFLLELGVFRVLTDRKLASKLLPALSTLAFDSAQEVRTHARVALRLLGGHREAVAAVGKYVPLKQQPSVYVLLFN